MGDTANSHPVPHRHPCGEPRHEGEAGRARKRSLVGASAGRTGGVLRRAVLLDRSIGRLRSLASVHQLTINPIIYAEIALSFSTLEGLDRTVSTLALELREVPRPALFLAVKAFVQYRRRGGRKRQLPPDFFMGAHAAVEGWPLLTRDASRFRTCFPTLEVIAP